MLGRAVIFFGCFGQFGSREIFEFIEEGKSRALRVGKMVHGLCQGDNFERSGAHFRVIGAGLHPAIDGGVQGRIHQGLDDRLPGGRPGFFQGVQCAAKGPEGLQRRLRGFGHYFYIRGFYFVQEPNKIIRIFNPVQNKTNPFR